MIYLLIEKTNSNHTSPPNIKLRKSDRTRAQAPYYRITRLAKVLVSYGTPEPLLTLGTLSAKVVSTRSKAKYQADFVVIEGTGRTLFGQEMAEALGLLHVGPLQANSVVCEHSEDDIL